MIKLWFQLWVVVILFCTVSTVSANAAADSGTPALGGIGVLLSLDKPSNFVVQYVLPGMPAANANVQVGDVLLEVDGVPVGSAKTVEEIVDKIRGATGSSVKLKVQSGGKIREISLVRGTIPTVKPDAAAMDFGREVSVYFYQHEDLIPEDEPSRYSFMGDHSVADFLRRQLLRRGGHWAERAN